MVDDARLQGALGRLKAAQANMRDNAVPLEVRIVLLQAAIAELNATSADVISDAATEAWKAAHKLASKLPDR